MKHSLVIGGTGQDGAFLCKALLRKEHQVSATFRVGGRGFDKVEELGIRENITWLSFNLGQSSNLLNYIRENKPEHIYILSGLSDTHLSFKNPVSYFDKNTTSLISLVDELFSVVPDAKLFIFGSIDEYMCASGLVDENSGFAPVSPYGISRVASHMYCNYMIGYKKANIYYGVFSSHESILRDRKFFTAKIPEKIIKYLQSGTSFQVGDLSPLRDWGYAPEYMDIVSDLMESTAPYGEYFITTTILVSCEDYLNSFLTNAGIKYNLKKDFSGIHYFDESSGKLICSSVNSQFSNNFSHPSTSNDKLRSAIGRVPMKGVSDIIDEYISYYNFPNY